ncbi:hypothetical protein I0E98_15170 [Pseudomonas lalucatii]|nr:hypothetical protein [Pseudomonas lalucatii]
MIQQALTLAWLATYRRGLRDHLQVIGGAVALLCGLAVVGIIGIAHAHAFRCPMRASSWSRCSSTSSPVCAAPPQPCAAG